MPPDLVNGIAAPYLTQGILGSACLVLAWVAMKLWNKIEKMQSDHEIKIAAKDALIKELYDDRQRESKLGWEFAKDYKTQNDAILTALMRKGQG